MPESSLSKSQAFRREVLALVERIPAGRVMTYGQLALLCGNSKAAREVGYIMNTLVGAQSETVPWQRVINAQGRISTEKVGLGDVQRALLEAEGIVFDATGRCDLKTVQWWPDGGEQGGLFG